MKTNSQSNILITTALTDTWGNSDQKAFLLGEWCKTMQNESLLSLKDYNQLPHHWSDRKKFIKDYEYLESFYERVLKSLADHLNKYHGTKHTLRYWRILLGPWLLTYVAIVWERWESLRLAFEGKDFDEVHFLKLNRDSLVPSDYNAFRVYNMLDHWNHHLFSEIIRYQYSDQINVKYLNQDENAEIDIRIDIDDIQPTKGKILGFIDRCLSIQKKYKVVFVEPYFDRLSFLSLALRLKQLPRGHYEFFQKINYPSVNEDRYSRSIQINATNDFEIFFQQHIFSQIPIAYLEGYKELNRVAESIKTRGEIIFTANAHLDNDLFNCWAGDQVEKGKRLVVSQHGGAIRSNYTNFDHQEKIADSMTVWHKPYMNNHIQLTPNKMIQMKRTVVRNKEMLTLATLETYRYPYRAQACPAADAFVEDFDQKIQFIKALESNIYQKLSVRALDFKHGGTRSKVRYASDLGHDKISNSSTFEEALSSSRIVVCTSAQTTFSEAMHSNIPTILLFCEEHWPLHPQFDGLIEKLKQNNIIFTDPIKAAEHINQVWDNPDEWWHDSSTREAVNYFFKMCGNVSDDWVNEWASFFQSQLSKANYKNSIELNPWHYSGTNILAMTALTDTWGNSDQKAFLLGEWCKTMQNESLLSLKDYNQLPYHWSDRKKFIKDYEYLESFYERVLKSLADHLNKYHGTKHTLRYWRILLGPWLLTYVAIVWERWESLRLAFEGKDFDEVHFLKLNRDSLVPQNYYKFDTIWTDDHWNHHLFSEIIRYQYSDQIKIHYLDNGQDFDVNLKPSQKMRKTTKGILLRIIDSCLGFIQRRYKVVFVEPYFNIQVLMSISSRLGQLSRLHYEFSQKINYPSVNEDRYSRSIQINATNDFEIFFQQHIFSQIPIAYLEGYKELNRVAESIKTRGEIIFTANAHLDNDLFNCWAGDQVEKGKRLVVSQHGGAIRSQYQFFDHQEKIADSMTVWHKPYMNNHIQLTPNKLISGFRQSFFKSLFKKPNNNLTLVGFETSRYSFRAQAGPFAKNYSEDYEQKIQFVQSLKKNIVDDLTIRSFSRGNGWTRSKDRYASDLGHDKISNSSTLKEAFAYSKIVVCTYPQTTFSEAMHSNIPTILLFCEEHWPLHPQFDGLIEKLKQNNIIFTDPIKAAEHINQVWDNPDEWWHDSSTREAVNYFFKMCGNVSDDWVNEWASFFEGENHRAIIETEGLIERDAQGYLSIKIQFKMILMNIFTSFIQLFLPLLRTKIGRVILEIVSNDLMSNIREIEHNDIKLSFLEMNRLTKFRIDTFSTKEPETLDWIDSFEEESVFWDIGANIGLYTCYAAKKHNCNTIAFEPSVFNLELLARNVWANDLKTQITIIPLPLTELIKTANMSMSNTDHGGALSTFGEDYGPDGESLNASFEYKMMGLSMDDAVNIFDLPSPNHIKIDVDGIEHLILKGGDQVLTNADSILIEINDAFIEQAQRTNQYLERSGFMLKEKTHAEHYDNVVLFKGIEGTTYNQIWVKKVNN